MKLSKFGYYKYMKMTFIVNTQSLEVSPEAPFNWKLLLTGIVSSKGIWKNVPILQVGWPTPYPSHTTWNYGSFDSYRGSGVRLTSRYCTIGQWACVYKLSLPFDYKLLKTQHLRFFPRYYGILFHISCHGYCNNGYCYFGLLYNMSMVNLL